MPKAYVVAMIQVNNMEGMSPYMAGVEGTVTEHGGRFLVRHMGESSTPKMIRTRSQLSSSFPIPKLR